MKRLICLSRIVLFLGLSLVLPMNALAMENEPIDFRGIQWGADISTVPDMTHVKTAGTYKWYYLMDDKMTIGDESVDKIFYGFGKDKFCAVFINFDGPAKFNKLKDALSNIHGKPHHPDKYRDLYITLDRYRWFGKDINIEVVFNERKKIGEIKYQYLPIVSKKDAN